MSKSIFPIGFLNIGCDAIVKDFVGGKEMRQRLTEMGLICGARIRVIKNGMGGPLIVSINDVRLAIGWGMALKIMVEEVI